MDKGTVAPGRIWLHGEDVTTSDRIEEQSFCYDPDFPPDVAEGLPLTAAAHAKPDAHAAPMRRALKACGNAAAAVTRRGRSSR
jgi:hypothetical protein